MMMVTQAGVDGGSDGVHGRRPTSTTTVIVMVMQLVVKACTAPMVLTRTMMGVILFAVVVPPKD